MSDFPIFNIKDNSENRTDGEKGLSIIPPGYSDRVKGRPYDASPTAGAGADMGVSTADGYITPNDGMREITSGDYQDRLKRFAKVLADDPIPAPVNRAYQKSAEHSVAKEPIAANIAGYSEPASPVSQVPRGDYEGINPISQDHGEYQGDLNLISTYRSPGDDDDPELSTLKNELDSIDVSKELQTGQTPDYEAQIRIKSKEKAREIFNEIKIRDQKRTSNGVTYKTYEENPSDETEDDPKEEKTQNPKKKKSVFGWKNKNSKQGLDEGPDPGGDYSTKSASGPGPGEEDSEKESGEKPKKSFFGRKKKNKASDTDADDKSGQEPRRDKKNKGKDGPLTDTVKLKYTLKDAAQARTIRFNVNRFHYYDAAEVDDAMDAMLDLITRMDNTIRDYEKYLAEEEMIRKWEGRY